MEQTIVELTPHLRPDDYAWVGGMAIRYWAITSGQAYPDRPFNDLDIVARDMSTVQPSIAASRLMIAHWHPQGHDAGQSWYAAIVDPEAQTVVDVFNWPAVDPAVHFVPCGGQLVPIQSAEDQLAKTIIDTTKVLGGVVIDPKQFSDAALLWNVADLDKSEQIFAGLVGDREVEFSSLREAFVRARQALAVHPELAVLKPFHKSAPYDCAQCVPDATYPIQPLTKMYEALGYVT